MHRHKKAKTELGKRSAADKVSGSSARCGADVAGTTSPSTSNCYKIGTWNVRSLMHTGKLAGIIQEMIDEDIDLMGISEKF